MVAPERWRVCMGTKACPHEPRLFYPSEEDIYEVHRASRCECSSRGKRKLKRECAIHCERCPVQGCNRQRKELLAFDYLPIGPQLKSLCASRTFCHEFLSMWRDKKSWLEDASQAHQLSSTQPICEWWNGLKVRECNWFWNPECKWELPVICKYCKASFQAHPIRCEQLEDLDNWNALTNSYEFPCPECSEMIISKQAFANVSIFFLQYFAL